MSALLEAFLDAADHLAGVTTTAQATGTVAIELLPTRDGAEVIKRQRYLTHEQEVRLARQWSDAIAQAVAQRLRLAPLTLSTDEGMPL